MITGMQPYTREEGAEALQRAGLSSTIAPWEDGLREQPRPGTLEWWYFDAHLDDGSALVVVFMTKPTDRSAGAIAPLLKVQLTLPSGEIIEAHQPFPAEALRASRDQCDVQLGPNWVRGDLHRYELSSQSPDLSMRLTLTDIVPSSRIGTGKTLIGDKGDYLGWLIAVPRGTVEGAITLRGQTRSVHGEGYHDHNWGTIPFEDYLREWYWGRAYLGNYTVIFSETHALPAYGDTHLAQILLARGPQVLLSTSRGAQMRIDRERQEGTTRIPEVATFVWSDGTNQATLTLNLTKVITNEARGPLHMLRFLANGALRIQLKDIREEAQGPVMYEHPTFRKGNP